MEFAPAGTIMDYLQRNGAVDEAIARNWCKQLCLALRYLHSENIAHRDVKCDNILLDKDLQIKVADFDFCCKAKDSTKDQMILSYTYCGSCLCQGESRENKHKLSPEFPDVLFGRSGLVVWSRLRDRRDPGSKTDSTEDPSFIGPITVLPPPVFVEEDMGRNGRGLWKDLPTSANAARGTDLASSGRPTQNLQTRGYVKTVACPSSSLSVHHPPSLGHSRTRPHWADKNTALPGSQKRRHRPLWAHEKDFNLVRVAIYSTLLKQLITAES
ncbi:hypothetical protein AVEN_268067-1 [Araneus ventricosus]|uniref:Serine/threonine-protein kinase greatwall n=1 Tax=Araneus ventricosus TaxID=182803 RepID=A0A4Y2KPV8_ARAVE|nr:hypothetical protein AVEN_268067-1 [Araneus ventricosus]